MKNLVLTAACIAVLMGCSQQKTEKTMNTQELQLTQEWDKVVECMATAAAAVSDYMKGKIVYIAVMNNISIDCDCNGNPAKPQLRDMGILASTDPVALDQACIDLVYRHKNTEGDNATPLIHRIEDRHGLHILEHAAKIGLGSRQYKMVHLH